MKRYAAYKSVSAPASRTAGAVGLAVAVTALLAQRFGVINADVFVLSLIAAAAVALVSLGLAISALYRIWSYGGSGIPAALLGALFGGLALVPSAMVVGLLVIRPGTSDLSTDRVDPPDLKVQAVSEEQPFLTWMNAMALEHVWPILSPTAGGGSAAGSGAEPLYPDIVSRRYRIAPAQLHAASAKAVEALNWTVVDELPPDLLDAPTRLQAEGTSGLLGLKHDVTLRIRPDPVGALLDVRARSRTPLRDLSGNPDHIRAVFAGIDQVLLETYGDLSRLSVEEDGLSPEDLEPVPLEEPRESAPLPGFKPYFEEEDAPVADDLGLTDLEG
ncbi:DUF1499 domain-containing protein [Labrenzia sp. 011]|uniref:DUF1499 domain-containing protein n=1 Tax=Labrenzia sp. 011 TaxID=2171494 RepID=UPI000D51675E|nr:DUF1499 domain-containing protein [Labrenzia sp. 011]PVB62960.1 DUF1499 domain-containing protein [Labrenzia sp. 011]